MRTYLLTTGVLFALLAVLHLWHPFVEDCVEDGSGVLNAHSAI